jgi:hypothetical protein
MKTNVKLLLALIAMVLILPACSAEAPSPQTEAPDEFASEVETPEIDAVTETPVPTATVTAAPTQTATPDVEEEPLRILFIGSSHIFHGPSGHDLPRMFSGMAASGGHDVSVSRSAESGVWLIDHLDNPKTMDKLMEDWDYVILQEDMYMGAREDGRQENMYPAIRALDEEIRKSGAETILFNTWVNPAPIKEGNLDQYLANQALLSEGYHEIARELDLRLAPVDQAFSRSLDQRPELYLWLEEDEHGHANFLGSYLAAAVFYALIYQESPEGLDFIYSTEDISYFFQRIAAETVLGDTLN